MSDHHRFVFAVTIAALVSTCRPAPAQPAKTAAVAPPIAVTKADPPVSYSLLSEEDEANERRIQAALSKQLSLDLKEVPFEKVIAQLADECDITIVITKKIEDAGVKLDQHVTIKIVKASLRSCLRLILGDLNLTYMLKDDVIKITTVEDAQSPVNLSIRLYPVKDLVDLVKNPKDARSTWDFAPLIALIQLIEPDSWLDVGGPGFVKGFDNAACLLISQRDDVHETIGRLMITLRRVRAVQGLKESNAVVPNGYLTPPIPR